MSVVPGPVRWSWGSRLQTSAPAFWRWSAQPPWSPRTQDSLRLRSRLQASAVHKSVLSVAARIWDGWNRCRWRSASLPPRCRQTHQRQSSAPHRLPARAQCTHFPDCETRWSPHCLPICKAPRFPPVHPSFRDQIANTRKNRTIPNDIDYTSIIRIGENVNIFIARSAVRPALGPTAQTGSRYRWWAPCIPARRPHPAPHRRGHRPAGKGSPPIADRSRPAQAVHRCSPPRRSGIPGTPGCACCPSESKSRYRPAQTRHTPMPPLSAKGLFPP